LNTGRRAPQSKNPFEGKAAPEFFEPLEDWEPGLLPERLYAFNEQFGATADLRFSDDISRFGINFRVTFWSTAVHRIDSACTDCSAEQTLQAKRGLSGALQSRALLSDQTRLTSLDRLTLTRSSRL